MSRLSAPHLTPDDFDAWLEGHLAPEAARHLDRCDSCRESALGAREVVAQLTSLEHWAPAPGFADRVMARVHVPDPFALRALRAMRRRITATRRSLALAAGITLLVLGSMGASIAWSLANPDTLSAVGQWATAETTSWIWAAVRTGFAGVVEQPWYGELRALATAPGRIAAVGAAISLAYVAGVLALRRLLALPAPGAAHAI